MIWFITLFVYAAPPQAVDWDGPWRYGMSKMVEEPYLSEADCRNAAVQMIGRIHQDMLAPIRFQCVSAPANLPRGATR
jgi:hypothetical protein